MTVSDSLPANRGRRTPGEWRRAWLTIDQNPQMQAFVTTTPGMLLLHLAFMAVLGISMQYSTASLLLITMTVFAIALMPRLRLQIIVGSSLFYLAVRPFRINGWTGLVESQSAYWPAGLPPLTLQLAAVGLFLLFSTAFLLWQAAHKKNPLAKRPVLTLFTIWFSLFILTCNLPSGTPVSALLWSITGVSISCFWYLAYAACDQKTKDPTPTLARAGFMRAFWGGSATPMGKSFGYLNRFDAKDATDLAITRLKALKLAVWALLLAVAMNTLDGLLYGQLAIPRLQTAIVAYADNTAYPTAMNWAALITNYFMDLLTIAVWGHFIVATIRMIGYRIPRNTRNPLASRTLAEFWNRYFFYFKELLVDFFFYPAFLRYFKNNTRLRIAFATFCAAALGNFLYHFTRETYIFATLPVDEAFTVFQSAVFYSLALATGLIVSQWRGKKLSPRQGFLRYDVLPRLNVFAFFCFLKIFDDLTGNGSLSDRAHFTLSLFGY